MILISVEYRGLLPKPPKRILARIRKQAFLHVGSVWHRKIAPKHFTESGGREYKYARRSRGYRARKLKPTKGDRARGVRPGRSPLVWTGETRRLTLAPGGANIRATSKGVTIRLPGARGLNRRPKGGAIFMQEEMTEVSRGDERLIASEWRRHFLKSIRTHRRRTNWRPGQRGRS